MIDPKFTEKIALWLQSDHKSDENIKEGAMLLLQLNRDQAMYQRIIRRPQRELKFLEYKLQRFLKLRNDGKTVSDVVKLYNEIIPHLQAIIDTEPVPVEGQTVLLPVEQPAEKDGGNEMYIRKGIRPDHDKLPANIQAIWPANVERWKKIKEAFETCKSLTEPCDRYEYLKVLKETWYKYKQEMARYDDFRLPGDDSDVAPVAVPDAPAAGITLTPDQEKELANADSYISKNLPKLLFACKGNNPEDVAMEVEWRGKIQQRVDVLLKYGRTLTEERREQLLQCDIRLNPETPEEHGQGQESE